ncbi:DUF6401 family natural product biosynthesis protein [Nocardia sp. AG03]|uniref:DUF6401 family natural product biosynthesis protein n=1 Tax=Nocardia sp. AG03 TaxID=3025312 RepID=UPI0024184341|nr:DUF6401 family natural product biosynthesis protein [Nocardia sp. AG03]
MFSPGPALLEFSARRHLQQLNTEFGAPAVAAAVEVPGLTAELDQHAAAVRDILEFGVVDSERIPVNILLAGYVRGLIEHTEYPVFPPLDWQTADWLSLRIAAVCAHAGF